MQRHLLQCGYVKQNIIEHYTCQCDDININRNTYSHKRRKKCEYCMAIGISPMKICNICNIKVKISHECPLTPNFICTVRKRVTVRGEVFDFGMCGYSGVKLQVQKHLEKDRCKFYCPKCKLELSKERASYHGMILKDICPEGLYLCKFCKKQHIKGVDYKSHLKKCKVYIKRDSRIDELTSRYLNGIKYI